MFRHLESNGHTSLKANSPHPLANIVAKRSALGGEIKSAHISFQTLDISQSDFRGRLIRDPIIELQKMAARLGRKNNVARDHLAAFTRSA